MNPTRLTRAKFESLLDELSAIRADLVDASTPPALLDGVHAHFKDSARNLLHYLALRRRDLRPLQIRLAAVGLSSLGRAESHVLATVDAVLDLLHRLTQCSWQPPAPVTEIIDFAKGQRLLAEHSEALVGAAPPGRGVRIMVTMPREAAQDYTLIHDLLSAGMDCMRINCAHDDAATWIRMIDHLRRAERSLGRSCRIVPESNLRLEAMTAKDREDLSFVARNADVVELSFANSARDVESLQGHLQRLGNRPPAMVLKIETRRGFENLPGMLLTAMRWPSCGVMIARGDLAVECGFERMAEVQEEILWICEAAHVPVIWATQVLETLAKKGVPSRAEITDAAMGHRAECVMLNKGPHVLSAVRALDDILRRMQNHQTKKQSMLRELHLAHVLPTSRVRSSIPGAARLDEFADQTPKPIEDS